MNREIKFRAWDKENKLMFPHKLIDQYDKDGFMLWGDIFSGQDKTVELMQFTGIKDKYGKEIYEGDVVKLDDIICPITWDDGGFQMITDKQQGKSPAIQNRLKYFEVIGNIYENPELLKTRDL